jgi:outer membrane protein assembly factor BamB
MNTSPAIGSDGTIYVGCSDYYLYAVDSSGQKKWELDTGGLISADSPVVGSDGTIYVTAGSSAHDGRPQVSGRLLAVSPAGEQKWAVQLDAWADSAPGIGADGTIYACATQNLAGGHLFAVSPQGTLKWKFAIADMLEGSPTIGSDGTIYACALMGAVFAVAPDGAKKWKWTTPWARILMADSPVIGRDGTLYVGSDDSFYAFKGPAQRTSTSVTISRSIATVKVHKALVLKGTLSPGKLHDQCIVEVRPAGKTAWRKLKAVLTSTAKGAWSYRCVPAKRGTYEYRARFAGDSSRMASVSRVVQVVVK